MNGSLSRSNDSVIADGGPREIAGLGGSGPAPASLDPAARGLATPFVGRELELAHLNDALASAASGTGRLVLLLGEPGVGKTRVAVEVAAQARAASWLTVLARCPEGEAAPAFWPWAQAVRGFASQIGSTDRLQRAVGPHAAELVQLVPTIVEHAPVRPRPAVGPESARFRFFDAVSSFLRAVAAERPTLLVLDDLHGADVDSLRLLRFVTRDLADARLLVIGTYRDVEVHRDHPLSEVLAELVREPFVTSLPLGGFTKDEVTRFVAQLTGSTPGADVAAQLYRRTEGNAFFLTETLRLFLASRQGEPPCDQRAIEVEIPNSVREVVRKRLRALTPPSYEALEIAALLGREFDLFLLERVSGKGSLELLSHLEDGLRSRIVQRVPGTARLLRFVHALVRDTLYEDIDSRRRVELHRKVGETLEATYGSAPERALGDLAHHFERSAIHGDAGKAVSYARRAARHARSQFAYAEAAGYLERAARWMERDLGHDPVELCELTLELADAYIIAGKPAPARETFRRAGTMAEGLGRPQQLARAAIGVSGPVMRFGVVDHGAISLLESALRSLPPDAYALRARAMARLAIELQNFATSDRRDALAEEARQLAEKVGDVRTLADLMIERRSRLWRSQTLERRIADSEDLIRLADRSDEVELGLDARSWLILDLLEAGDVERARREMEAYGARAEPLRLPIYTHRDVAYQTIRAVFDGRLEEAESLSLEFLSVARRVSDWQANSAFACQLFMIRRLRGTAFDDIILPAERLVAEYPTLDPARVGLALGYLEMGRVAEARREYERYAQDDFALVGEDIFWAGTLTFLADLCAAFEDAPRAAQLYEILLPHASRNVVLGLAGTLGPVARTLGVLATTIGDFASAERHFVSSLEMCQRMAAIPFAALTRHSYASALLRRGDAADLPRAAALLDAAQETALRIGMARLTREVAEQLARMRAASPRAAPVDCAAGDQAVRASGNGGPAGAASRPPAGGPVASAELVWRREADYWSIGAAEAPLHLRDSVGVRCIAELLRRPGEELLALELAELALGVGPAPSGGSAGLGPAVDARAGGEYRRRLAELRSALELAHELQDAPRAGQLRAEIELVAGELSRSIGLGGRARPAGSPIERARVNVTRTIRDAIRRVESRDALLGRHLRASVRTGTFCGYFPAAGRAPRWRM